MVAYHWLDWPSAIEHRDTLKEKGYLPHIPFNIVLDHALDIAGMKRSDIYITQAFYLLPRGRSEEIPREYVYRSFEYITRHEITAR